MQGIRLCDCLLGTCETITTLLPKIFSPQLDAEHDFGIGVQNILYCSEEEYASAYSMRKIVLIADDSASMRLSVRMLLEGRHTELLVCEAVDGVDAIRKAKTSQPDLILLDLAMPRLNGAEAAAVLKNDLPETPIILFTSTDLLPNSLCEAIGVDFISKADGIPKLLERVDALLPPTPPNNSAAPC